MKNERFSERKHYDPHLLPTSLASIVPYVLQGELGEHAHDYLEIFIVRSGSALHRVRGVETRLAPGDIYVLGAGVSHAFAQAQRLEHFNIAVRPAFFNAITDEVKNMAGYQALFAAPPGPVSGKFRAFMRLSATQLTVVESLMERALAELALKGKGYQALADLNVLEMVIRISRAFPSSSNQATEPGDPLARAVGYLEANWNAEMKVEVLADLFGASVRHFDRAFKAHFHLSPIRYLLRRRLQHAQEMLTSTRRSVTEIALDCGFSDSNYFSRQFRRFTGVRPSDVRRG
jgi:AraC-like DNA-binding protein